MVGGLTTQLSEAQGGSDAGGPGRVGEVSPGSCTLCTEATAVLEPTKVGVAESPAGGALIGHPDASSYSSSFGKIREAGTQL